VERLVEAGYTGVCSIECEAEGGPLLEQSLAWVRRLGGELGARVVSAR
jgi:sugar phosphate isomerase/epimerase